MKSVQSILVDAKHWQIFILLFLAHAGMFLITQIAYLAVAMMLHLLCFIAWYWSIGSLFVSLMKPPLRMKLGRFHFALVYPLLYFPLFFSSALWSGPLLAVIIPLHLIGMLCMFYLLNFVSKGLVMVETGTVPSFFDYAGPFFLFWFYPVGIWYLQPRINRLHAVRAAQH